MRESCRGDIPIAHALKTIKLWTEDGLKNIRFSGGEPMMYPHLETVVNAASSCQRIAVSTNGSFPIGEYFRLVDLGVNDFSISLDACCSSHADKISGVAGKWKTVVENIRKLAAITYVTVGVVLTEDNVNRIVEIVEFASSLGVADIRIISAAQYNRIVEGLEKLSRDLLDKHPILRYRVQNMLSGHNVRGIEEYDSHRCFLVLDDSMVFDDSHYPCVIHFREGGKAIGKVGPKMRRERVAWSELHDSSRDSICKENCLDVCVDYNNQCARFRHAEHQPGTVHV